MASEARKTQIARIRAEYALGFHPRFGLRENPRNLRCCNAMPVRLLLAGETRRPFQDDSDPSTHSGQA